MKPCGVWRERQPTNLNHGPNTSGGTHIQPGAGDNWKPRNRYDHSVSLAETGGEMSSGTTNGLSGFDDWLDNYGNPRPNWHDNCPRCPVCGKHRHGGMCINKRREVKENDTHTSQDLPRKPGPPPLPRQSELPRLDMPPRGHPPGSAQDGRNLSQRSPRIGIKS